MGRRKRIFLFAAALALGLVLWVMGVRAGELRTIQETGSVICMSCIGVGAR